MQTFLLPVFCKKLKRNDHANKFGILNDTGQNYKIIGNLPSTSQRETNCQVVSATEVPPSLSIMYEMMKHNTNNSQVKTASCIF